MHVLGDLMAHFYKSKESNKKPHRSIKNFALATVLSAGILASSAQSFQNSSATSKSSIPDSAYVQDSSRAVKSMKLRSDLYKWLSKQAGENDSLSPSIYKFSVNIKIDENNIIGNIYLKDGIFLTKKEQKELIESLNTFHLFGTADNETHYFMIKKKSSYYQLDVFQKITSE